MSTDISMEYQAAYDQTFGGLSPDALMSAAVSIAEHSEVSEGMSYHGFLLMKFRELVETQEKKRQRWGGGLQI